MFANPTLPIKIFLILTIVSQLVPNLMTSKCTFPWEGFGVHLGALASFNQTDDEIQKSILSHLYDDLKLRHYRTEYLHQFSAEENKYSIACIDEATCSWIKLHSLFSSYLPPEKSLIVSIWSPPYYMKNWLRQLKTSYEQSYYYYITNITAIVKNEFNLNVEKISIANEPENMFAPWDVCVMTPDQLCRIIQSHNDPLIALCPENAWYSTSKIYREFVYGDVNCRQACSVMDTHGYEIDLNPFENFGRVHYDLTKYPEDDQSPVWLTEISSNRESGKENKIDDAIDMSINIVNFVGTTCFTRWYFWYSFTTSPSGESLIWLDQETKTVFLTKKYYAYRHFTQAAYGLSDRVDCSTDDYQCLQFLPNGKSVWVNSDEKTKQLKVTCNLCCTTDDSDYHCNQTNVLPSRSICSC